MAAKDHQTRAALVQHYQGLVAAGLCLGTSGNISTRYKDGLLITPSGIPASAVTPDLLVYLPAHCTPPIEATVQPSSEWRFHRDILVARPEINAIVHTHAPHVTALAINRQSIPPIHYMVAAFGGDSVRCAPYALFGSQALSDYAVTALNGRLACLLANHGAITLGEDLTTAINLAHELELLARQYILALQAGTPTQLSAEELAAVHKAFASYYNVSHENQRSR